MNNVGTIIELERDGAIVMVSDCGFVLIRREKGMFLGQQVNFTDNELKNSREDRIKFNSTISAVVAVFIIISALFIQMISNTPLNNTYAFVCIDINPSMEFLVSEDNLVLGVKDINKDAKNVIKGFEVRNKQIGDVIADIKKIAEEKGYIEKDDKNIILVSVSLNPDMEISSEREQQYENLIEEICKVISSDEGNRIEEKLIKVPSELKKQADKNGLSIGRQYIYEKSKEQNMGMSIDYVRKTDISKILGEVDITYHFNESKDERAKEPTLTSKPIPTPNFTKTPVIFTSTPAEVNEIPTVSVQENKPSETPAPTREITFKPTPKPTPKPTQIIIDNDYARISGKVDKDRIVLKWQAPKRTVGFKYYKVVASKDNVHPRYPQDGYLYVISDIGTNTAVVDNSQSYIEGDFGSYFSYGQKYYFSVTTVYEDLVVPGDVMILTYPVKTVQDSTHSSLKLEVKGRVSDGKVVLTWNPINVEGFTYYKIVISKNNPNPKYPEDGYLYYIEDANNTEAVIDNSMDYNGGDFGKRMEQGQKYYFSVTLVYSGKKVPGNSVQLIFPN